MPTHDDSLRSFEVMDISLKFEGGHDAEHSKIDLYDLSIALRGFHRSLAITTHYFFHNEIITRAPEAKDIKIITKPPTVGSYEIAAWVGAVGMLATGLFKLGTAPKNTPIGHLVWSLYDMVVHKCTGQHVDFEKSLYYQHTEDKNAVSSKIESLAQKIEIAIQNMHRPILTQSALKSVVGIDASHKLILDSQTLDFTNRLIIEDTQTLLMGRIAAYSANTRSGMVYTEEEKRAIPFELDRDSAADSTIIPVSLMLYNDVVTNNKKGSRSGFFKFLAKRVVNHAGMTKKYYLTYIYKDTLEK